MNDILLLIMIYEILLETNVDLGYYKCNTYSIILGWIDRTTWKWDSTLGYNLVANIRKLANFRIFLLVIWLIFKI